MSAEQNINDDTCKTSANLDDLLHFVQFGDNFQKEALLSNPNMTADLLAAFISFNNLLPFGVAAVKAHPNCTPTVLALLP
jgi:hypothetical protein